MIKQLFGHEDEAKRIHQAFFVDEFGYPLNDKKVISKIASFDDNGVPVVVGGLKIILEAVLLTDKLRTKREIHKAFHEVLTAFQAIGHNLSFDELHAFVQDENWEQVLKKHYNFRSTKGRGLLVNI